MMKQFRFLLERLLQRGSQCSEIFRHVFAEMHSQRAPSALCEHGEVTSRLSCLHDAEGILLSGHGEINGIVASDLQKHSAVGPPFVRLTGRVQKARPESENGGNYLLVANRVPNLLQCTPIGVIHCDVAEDAEVVTWLNPREVSL